MIKLTKYYSIKILGFFGLGVFMVFNSSGQVQDRVGAIQNQDFTIEKERKIEIQPEITRTFDPLIEIENPNKGRKMSYDLIERKLEVEEFREIEIPIIDPREGDELKSPFGDKFMNIVKLGAGNYGHTMFNGHIGFNPNPNQFRGLYMNHNGNRKGPDNSIYSRRNDQELRIYSKSFTEKYLLNGSIGYRNLSSNYYGRSFIPGTADKDAYLINYEKFNYTGEISNAVLDSKIDYHGKSALTFTQSNNLNKEWVWNSEIKGVMKLNNEFNANLKADMILSEFTTSSVNNRRQLYRIQPNFSYNANDLAVSAGLNVLNEKDNLLGLNSTNWYPQLKVDYKALDFLHVFVGLEGDTHFNSFVSNSFEMPWFSRNMDLKNTKETLHIFGGIKGSNEKNLDYELKIGYSEFENMAFWVPSLADTSQFEILYDGNQAQKVQVFGVSGQINYQVNERYLSVLRFSYNNYQNLALVTRPFSRPLFNLSFLNSIQFRDRIIISPDLYYISGLYGWRPQVGEIVKMDDIVDLNLKVNYLITKKFNSFVQINNILGKQYQRYLNYPIQGLNYSVGLSYSF